ncbi:ribosomal protein S15, putative [Talaromyces stipitatus ATCC 10500]|uniref:Ribosomal protein S15, putative n=1 Tax=Talaromyces stipitatus (strain ATCC 10500 / CBS 375.48 / QM 6759 / NRRL 1006) TaxID=441959 RepID=B8M6L0_TALSN|nr:ribosomal protein S15, putative [Talaromyces stipitatus ATCC 10500]EED19472.1 ribosomal protein S15, putative [Talaromyces stipitatus ATCC 10500]
MPPRLSIQGLSKPFSGSSHISNPLTIVKREPCKIDIRAGSFETRQRRRHDPFLMAQSRQRRAANISRQQALDNERQAALGDPVKSEPTPFIQQIEAIQSGKDVTGTTSNVSTWNHFIKADEFELALEYSKALTEPLPPQDANIADPEAYKQSVQQHEIAHHNAREAMHRIVQLSSGNTADRTRVNIEACIETFGRHNTDKILPPKPTAVTTTQHPEKTPRAGPDTGSPEVQVAILTTKIMNLSRHLQSTNKDRHNKRNLRVLVHKRQKLLQYLRRKERGGPRWQNLMTSLGLSDAAWKGEISM